MKMILMILTLVAVVSACAPTQPDAMPDDAMRVLKTSGVVPKPDAAMAAGSGESLAQLGNGYSIFLRKCSECHEPRVPQKPSDPSWHPTMVGMSWNAGLTTGEQGALVAYLRAAGGMSGER